MNFQLRLFLCRLGFLLLCVLPTAIVGGWIVTRSFRSGANAQITEWERELTGRLGLIAEIERLSYPRRDVACLVGLKLLDPETRRIVAQSSEVEIASLANGWQAAASQVVVDGDELASLARIVEQRILRGPAQFGSGNATTHIALVPQNVLLRFGDQHQTLEQAGGDLEVSADAVKLAVQFRLAGVRGAAEPLRLTVIRDRAESPPRTQWQLVTRGTALPCRLAAGFAPQLAHLGHDCQFSGVIHIGDSPHGVRGQVAGTLFNVDLDALVTEQFPHQLSGQATVRIDQALVEKDKLIELRGAMQAHHGAISRSLVAAAAEHLGLTANATASEPRGGENIAFRQLAIDFRLTGRSLTLAGSADPTTAGTLVGSASGPILSAPPDHAVAAAALLRTVLPNSELQVPAARQTMGLLNLLPVPDVVRAPAAPLPAHTPTRLAPAPAEAVPSAVRPPVLR
jgi:hypothetical protein